MNQSGSDYEITNKNLNVSYNRDAWVRFAHRQFRGDSMRRTMILMALALLVTGAFDATPALSQTKDQITGVSCKALLRSCMRICIRHQGEPDYNGCQADCTNGARSCNSTLTWKSRNATIVVKNR
jgi:hypothetical protein